MQYTKCHCDSSRYLFSGFFMVLLLLVLSAGCRQAPPPSPYKAPEGASAESGRPWVFMSATEMAESVRNKSISSVDLVRAHLNQIHRYNPKLNAIITIDEGAALEQARKADASLASGEIWGPLHGVPVTIKDHFAVKGMRTTNAFPPLADQVTDFDATVVQRLRDAGAIILGRTNMPVLAMDMQTNNPIFGRTNNPWDINRTTGGSTGGGAAAVAAGMSPLEIGSDIGGSIRIPSHFCGVFGIKPTENAVSAYGNFPGLSRSKSRSVRYMASIGPLARSIPDLKLCMSIISGPDGKDALVTPTTRSDETRLSGGPLRIAWTDNFGGVSISADTRRVLETAVKKLAGAGFTVNPARPEIDFNIVWMTWGQMIDMQIGMQQPGIKRFLMYTLGGFQRAKSPLLQIVFPIDHEDYIEIMTRRDLIISQVDQFLSGWDVFICPVVIRQAIPHHAADDVIFNYNVYNQPVDVDGNELNYWTALGSYTTPFNLTGHPVVVIPAGFASDGMPIGIQIVGKRFHDFELLDMAERINEIAGAYRQPAGY